MEHLNNTSWIVNTQGKLLLIITVVFIAWLSRITWCDTKLHCKKDCLQRFNRWSCERRWHFPIENGFQEKKEKCRLESEEFTGTLYNFILESHWASLYSWTPSNPHLGQILIWSSSPSFFFTKKVISAYNICISLCTFVTISQIEKRFLCVQ